MGISENEYGSLEIGKCKYPCEDAFTGLRIRDHSDCFLRLGAVGLSGLGIRFLIGLGLAVGCLGWSELGVCVGIVLR